jgi:2-phospho-L-lactate transferase/gluconeogenesis factor (CofD/UPF0052 family)
MTEPGETDDFTLERHLDVIQDHVGLPLFDYVLANNSPIAPDTLVKYARNCAEPVRRASRAPRRGRTNVVERPLAWQVEDGKLRHDPHCLSRTLTELIGRTSADHEWRSTIPA